MSLFKTSSPVSPRAVAPYDTITSEQSSSLNDLNSMKEIFEELNECMKQLREAAEAANEAASSVSKHNLDETSHEDIRQKLEAVGDISSDSISEQIGQHNISPTAHSDIRSQVTLISSQISAVDSKIITAVNSHNSSSTAHSDLRAQINALKLQIGDLNIGSITEEIRKDLDEAVERLEGSISTVQTSIAQIQQTVNHQTQQITQVNERVTQTNTKLTVIANTSSSSRTDVDDVALRIEELRLLHDYLDEAENPNSPYQFTHTLPNTIAPGKSKSFTMHVSLKESHVDAEFTITPISTDLTCTFTKQSAIAQDEAVTIEADEENTAGKIYAFRVDAKDKTNSNTITRVVCIMMARPFESGNISIDNFPTNVEPNHDYTIRVINLDDAGDGGFTYKLESDSEHVTFDPADASAQTQFTMKVGADQERDVDVRCTLTVHNTALETDTVISEDTHINPLPSKDGFRHTVPSIVKPNQTVNVQFYGITSIEGINAKYKIKTKPEWLTFTPDSDIYANQNVSCKVSSSASRGTSDKVTVTSHDANDVEFDFDITVKVNQLPSSAGITTTLAESNAGGKAVTFRIMGATDPDEDTSKLTYTIDPMSSGLTFNKQSGITSTTDVQVNLPKVADDTVKTFKVYAVDSQGERSTDDKSVSTTITPLWIAEAPRILTPTEGAEVPYEGFTVTWTEFTYHADISS